VFESDVNFLSSFHLNCLKIFFKLNALALFGRMKKSRVRRINNTKARQVGKKRRF
jgi:hypothetical protein